MNDKEQNEYTFYRGMATVAFFILLVNNAIMLLKYEMLGDGLFILNSSYVGAMVIKAFFNHWFLKDELKTEQN